MPFARLAPATAIALTAIGAAAVAADTYLPPDDREPPRPTYHHGHVVHDAHVVPQDEVVLRGPLHGLRARVVAVQHKFFDAEPWVELLAMQPDDNGHLYWLMVPACALERVRQ